ncbi:MAG: ABC transporter substrate-binding protein [Candidatus Methanoplasma sp.]|jgi:ABC-type nitrate/sulfonate/bicarbonate transport system substrate-binding protein|nr:ABC transporter substrate-binding protein [Candidatus Methanoplasma sp.]
MTEKKTVVIAVAAVVILVIAAFLVVFALPGNSDDSDGKYTIKANVTKDCTGTPFYVGTDIGYFDANNINFVDQGELDYGLVPTALLAGRTNIYDGHPNTIINLLQSGAKVKGVVMTGYEPDNLSEIEKLHMHWLVDKTRTDGKTITSVAELFEKVSKPKIAVLATGVCADLEVQILLDKYGKSAVKDYDIIQLTDPNQEAALQSGQIDVAVLHPPFYSAVEGHNDVNVIAVSTDTLGQYAGVSLLVFTESFIADHPDTVRQFIIAYKAAQRWSNDHQVEAGRLTADTIGLDNAVPHWASYSGKITDADLQPWIDALVKFGYLEKDQFKPSDLYTTEFSDLWVQPTKAEPLNPFNSETNAKYKWFDKVGDEESVLTEVTELAGITKLVDTAASPVVVGRDL